MIRAVAEGKRSPVRREPGTPLEYDTALDKVSPVERRAEVERFLQARRTAPDDRLSCEAHLAWLTALSELSPSLAAKLYADY